MLLSERPAVYFLQREGLENLAEGGVTMAFVLRNVAQGVTRPVRAAMAAICPLRSAVTDILASSVASLTLRRLPPRTACDNNKSAEN